jgi:hypothetical protein
MSERAVSRNYPLVKVPRSTQQQADFDLNKSVTYCVQKRSTVISVDARCRGQHSHLLTLNYSVTD